MGSVYGARAGPYRPATGPQRRKGAQEGLYGVYATLSRPRRRGPFHSQSVSGAATGAILMNSLERLARPSDLLMEVGSSQRDSDGYAQNTLRSSHQSPPVGPIARAKQLELPQVVSMEGRRRSPASAEAPETTATSSGLPTAPLQAPILDLQRRVVRRWRSGFRTAAPDRLRSPSLKAVSRQPARAPCGPGRACAREPVFCREGSRLL